MRSPALPSHKGGVGQSCRGPSSSTERTWSVRLSVVTSLFVPWVMVTGRSVLGRRVRHGTPRMVVRSDEHTSELQSRGNLVCRLLLEKKNKLSLSITLSNSTT